VSAPLSPLLVASLVLSAVSLLLPDVGPLGPLVAGVLAFLGHRQVARSKGAVRGPALAKAAMTAALVLFALHAWAVVRGAAAAAAWTGIRAHLAAVEGVLRDGTAEGAYGLLSEEARARTDRVAWVKDLGGAMERLGPIVRLGEPEETGGDWDRTATFGEGDSADLRLSLAFDAEFRDGRGRVEIEVRATRAGREVSTGLESLRVSPVEK